MSDTTLRISVVVNKELDPDVYELLTSITSSKSRSEFARILMRSGAAKEIKSRRMATAKVSDKPQAKHPNPNASNATETKKISKQEAGKGEAPGADKETLVTAETPRRPLEGQVAAGAAAADDDFVDGFVTGIQGVPKR